MLIHGVWFLIFFFGVTCPEFLFSPRVELLHFLLCTIVAIISVVASSFLATFGTKFQTSGVYGRVVIAHAPLQECVLYQTLCCVCGRTAAYLLESSFVFSTITFLVTQPASRAKIVRIYCVCAKRKGRLYGIDLFRIFFFSVFFMNAVSVYCLVVGLENCQPET